VAFKKGMSLGGQIGIGFNIKWLFPVVRMLFTPYVLVGLLLYTLSTLLWLVALSRCSLNFAYPFTAATFVLVILLSAILLGEPLPLSRLIGVLIIIGGIFVVALK
jgi:uncharacterized membrane protein